MTTTSIPFFTSWLVRSAALYAAIDPVTPRTTVFFINIPYDYYVGFFSAKKSHHFFFQYLFLDYISICGTSRKLTGIHF
jgi:hypothetical protein